MMTRRKRTMRVTWTVISTDSTYPALIDGKRMGISDQSVRRKKSMLNVRSKANMLDRFKPIPTRNICTCIIVSSNESFSIHPSLITFPRLHRCLRIHTTNFVPLSPVFVKPTVQSIRFIGHDRTMLVYRKIVMIPMSTNLRSMPLLISIENTPSMNSTFPMNRPSMMIWSIFFLTCKIVICMFCQERIFIGRWLSCLF